MTARQGSGNESDSSSWWAAIDGEILERLRERGAVTLGEVCEELGLSEGEATAVFAILAREDRVRICRVELVVRAI